MGRRPKAEKIMIRVHNRGRREYLIPVLDDDGKPKKNTEPKKIMPGRAVELPADQAEKYLKLYPAELINFEDLVSGKTKDLSQENRQLKAKSKKLEAELAELKSQLAKSKEESEGAEDDAGKSDGAEE